jgi:hypothetical protein
MPARQPEGKELIMFDQSKALLRRGLEVVAVASAVALLLVVAATSAFASETKTFTAVKTCSGLIPPTFNTQTCVINPSTLKILRGGTSHYLNIVFYDSTGVPVPRTSATYLSSPMLFTAIDHRQSTATGRCTFFIAGLTAGTGHCEWWSGTGKLTGFNSEWKIGTIALHVFSINGAYSFDRNDSEGD